MIANIKNESEKLKVFSQKIRLPFDNKENKNKVLNVLMKSIENYFKSR
jgi:hypothetical protein